MTKRLTLIEARNKALHIGGVSNSYSKDFKYTLQSKDGKMLLQSVVTFGTEKQPFPKDWKEDGFAQMALQNYKEEFINENFDIIISEDLDFDI
jgi:mRNA-degrading endonuclease YafQ of YafQ-DinJ toxin-antitoxin module